MNRMINFLLLLALPASGKSEVRKVLEAMGAEERLRRLHMGELVHLDDYPYVEFLRFTDEVADRTLHLGNIFYHAHDRSFADPWEWITLIELLNDDILSLLSPSSAPQSSDPALWLFDRIDQAELRAGARLKLGRLPLDVRQLLASHLQGPAQKILENRTVRKPFQPAEQTMIVEFSRGCGPNALMPLDPPMGYATSLHTLCPQILSRCGVLYVLVTPKQSRANNFSRAVPPPGFEGDTGIFHGVPTAVMLDDYSGDDMVHLFNVQHLDKDLGSSILVEAHGQKFRPAAAVMDNSNDLTTFARQPANKWNPASVEELVSTLEPAMDYISRHLHDNHNHPTF